MPSTVLGARGIYWTKPMKFLPSWNLYSRASGSTVWIDDKQNK